MLSISWHICCEASQGKGAQFMGTCPLCVSRGSRARSPRLSRPMGKGKEKEQAEDDDSVNEDSYAGAVLGSTTDSVLCSTTGEGGGGGKTRGGIGGRRRPKGRGGDPKDLGARQCFGGLAQEIMGVCVRRREHGCLLTPSSSLCFSFSM